MPPKESNIYVKFRAILFKGFDGVQVKDHYVVNHFMVLDLD